MAKRNGSADHLAPKPGDQQNGLIAFAAEAVVGQFDAIDFVGYIAKAEQVQHDDVALCASLNEPRRGSLRGFAVERLQTASWSPALECFRGPNAKRSV